MVTHPRRVLIISHVPTDGTYGASTSLRGHLEALNGQDVFRFGLFLPKSIHRGKDTKMSDAAIIDTFPSVSDVKHFYMMHRLNLYWSKRKLYVPYNMIRNFISFLNKARMIQAIREFRPDLIHLNSLALSPIAQWVKQDNELRSVPVLSHVREFLRLTLSQRAKREIAAVDTFICIDLAAQNRLLAVMDRMIKGNDAVIIQNPFRANDSNPDPDIFSNIDRHNLTVFAIAGQVSAEKGVKLVCEAFIKANLEKSVLLVVGRVLGRAGKLVKSLCDDHPSRLVWLGEQPDLLGRGFFNGIDAIVRGDSTYCTGRTVYEALFSGAGALLPGSEFELSADPDLLPFRDKVALYRPSDPVSLTRAFQRFVEKNLNHTSMVPMKREPLSNYHLYSQRILDCYERTVH